MNASRPPAEVTSATTATGLTSSEALEPPPAFECAASPPSNLSPLGGCRHVLHGVFNEAGVYGIAKLRVHRRLGRPWARCLISSSLLFARLSLGFDDFRPLFEFLFDACMERSLGQAAVLVAAAGEDPGE